MTVEPFSMLLYGEPGAGKSTVAVSAFWDWRARKQIRRGLWIQIGRESNPALCVPPELVWTFISPPAKPLQFMADLRERLKPLVVAARRGEGPEVIVFDGFSEWGDLYVQEHELKFGLEDKFARWDSLKRGFLELQQTFNPRELKAFVIATAHIDRKRKPIINKKTGETLTEGDPEYIEAEYIPAMQGQARKSIGYFYNLGLYMHTEVGTVKDAQGRLVQAPLHVVHMLPSEDYWVKNQWETGWLAKGFPATLANPTFDDILTRVEALQ